MRRFVSIAALNGFFAVGFGAFGAHGLKDRLTPAAAGVYETAAHYHLTHALAILAVAILMGQLGETKALRYAGWLFTIGIFLFSGSLYALAVTGNRLLGAVTPFGGLCFLAGWTFLALAARRSNL